MITFTDPHQLHTDGITPDKPYTYAAVAHGLCNTDHGLDIKNAQTHYTTLVDAFNAFLDYVENAYAHWYKAQSSKQYVEASFYGLNPYYEVSLTILTRDEKTCAEHVDYSISVHLTNRENYTTQRNEHIASIAIVDNTQPDHYEIITTHGQLRNCILECISSIDVTTLENVNWCPQTIRVYDQILTSLTTPQAYDVWNTYSTIGVYKTAIHAIKARLQSEIHYLVEHVAPYSVIARILPCFEGKTLYYTTNYLAAGDNPATLNWRTNEYRYHGQGLPVQTRDAMHTAYETHTKTTPTHHHTH